MSEQQSEFVGAIPRSVLLTALVRVGMVAACVACVGMVYWSLTQRLEPANLELQTATLELNRLSDAVDQLRLEGTSEGAMETRTRYKIAQAMLFARAEQFRSWQNQIRRKAALLALETKVTLEPARPYPGAEALLACERSTIELSPVTVAGQTTNGPPYQRLLKFAQGMVSGDRRWDLVGLTVEGNSNSVRHAEAVALLLTEPRETK